jgi:Mrp family chromosome partitioning ATPase
VVTANTALASARQGKRVLAVDADFGYQRLSSLLLGEVKDQLGVTDLVEKGVAFREVVQAVPLDGSARLDVISRGSVPVTAPDFFRSAGVKAFFEGVREEYDLVIIDSPPMLHVAYSSLLVRYADRTIVVIRDRAKVAPAEEIADRLAYLETEVMGYVYNMAQLREDTTRSYGSLEDVLGRKS